MVDDSLVREEHEILERNAGLELDELVVNAPNGLDRRAFLRRGLALSTGLSLGGVFESFLARSARSQGPGPGYGPLADVTDPNTGLPLLRLPEGFSYFSFGWTNDPIRGGVLTPSAHDGMAAIGVGEVHYVLIRNHERSSNTPFRAPTYDPKAGGARPTFSSIPSPVRSSRSGLASRARFATAPADALHGAHG
jgi:hypothetical protein